MFKIIYLTKETEYRRGIDTFMEQWTSEDDTIVAHTSGSTGLPKRIQLPKQDMRVSARATNSRFGINAESRMLCPLSADYIAGKMMIVRAIEADCEVAFCKPSNDFWNNPKVVGYLDEGCVDLLPVVPSQCRGLSTLFTDNRLKNTVSSISNIIVGGAAIPGATEADLIESKPEETDIFATYGMTETCSHVALRPLGENRFTAMPGISFSLDDRSCLRIMAPDYSFGTLQTNDIAEILSTGCFIWRGRFDNVINSGGIKIFPEELERKLDGKLPVRFYFKGEPDLKWGETVTIVIEEKPGEKPVPDQEIIDICRHSLRPFEIPGHIRRVREFPLTPNGKLRR